VLRNAQLSAVYSLAGIFSFILISGWLVFGISLFLLYTAFFAGLAAAPIAFRLVHNYTFICPGCLKNINARMDWLCTFCDTVNKNRLIFSSCRKCDDYRPSLICSNCGTEIIFNDSYNENSLKVERRGQI
jgi:hypothetical protein